MVVIFSVILGLYFLLVVVLLIGWIMVRRISVDVKGTSAPGISVVVAVRNETEHIENLIRSLSGILYPNDAFEVIIVNDHSTDDTGSKVQSLISKSPRRIKIVNLPEGSEGKKAALNFGIGLAKFDIIVTTDADCGFSKNWIKCIALHFEQPQTKMVIGAVKLTSDGSFFSRLQVTEFVTLVGSSASAIGLGHPIMCNGANLAFRKSAFNEVGGYAGNMQIASGDDEFLMRKIFENHRSGIRFLNFYEGVVTSVSQHSLKDFFYQRLRWAGKWRHNKDTITQLMAVFIFISQIAFVGLMIEHWNNPAMTLVWALTKFFLEGVFILWVGRFLDRKFDVLAFFALQILHPLYVIVVGASSLVASYRWKNRNYN